MDLGDYFDIDREFEHAGMIDWLTLKVDLSLLPEPLIRHLQSLNSKIFKTNPNGEIEWETYAWDSVRSDTHQVCFRVGSDFHIQGSPARIGLPNNVFGSLDIRYCANKMIAFAAAMLKVPLSDFPPLEQWICSRIDVARNFVAQSEHEARQALSYLMQSVAGRQKHSTEENGFYIGKRSTFQKGKAYLKGQDADRNQRAGRAIYTEEQLLKSKRLIRFEHTIARHRLKRLREQQNLHWLDLDSTILLELHTDYFDDYFSDIEVTDMSDILERLLKVAPTEGRARAAYDCYMRIRTMGYEQAKTSFTKTCWYRNIGFLKAAGFSRADLNASSVVPIRKRAIELFEAVRHWDDIRVA